MAASVYAQRLQPTRTPSTPRSTPTSLITDSPTTQAPATQSPVSGQEGCISRVLSSVAIQSTNTTRNYIVVTKRGRRRSFEKRHPDVGTPIIQSDGRGALPVTIVNDLQTAEMVRN